MPPVSPQGSRGGLITAVVVFTILFVTSTIFAIYYATALGKAEDKIADTAKRTTSIYGDTSSARFKEALDRTKSDPNLPEKNVVAVLIKETDDVSRAVLGANVPSTQPAQAAVDAAAKTIADARAKLNDQQIPDSGLIDAVNYLTTLALNQQAAAEKAKSEFDAAVTRTNAAIKDATDKVSAKDVEDKKQMAVLASTLDSLQKANQDYIEKFKDASAVMDKERQGFNDALTKAQNEKSDLEKQMGLKQKTLEAVMQRLAKIRLAPEEPITRKPDGAILTVASENIVYINLGQGDHITPGLTFEVYSKRDGVPPLGDGLSDTDMPIGEASIEVQQVNGASAQCRVTKLEPGQRIATGDPIANVVYDRNIKYNFVVYGQFDLMQSGHPNPADADVIKSLVVQWGGKIQTDINVDTDFIVMGSEPKVDNIAADESDPFKLQLHKQQLEAQKSYDDVIGKAKDLHIPIMNQNRFLYFCGYYDLATR